MPCFGESVKQIVCPERCTGERKSHCFGENHYLRGEKKMNVRQMTAKWSTRRGYPVQRMFKAAARSLGELARPTLAAFLAVVVAGGRVWAQDQPQQQPTPAPERPGLPTPQTPAQEVYTAPPKNPPIPVSLGSSKYHYTHAPKPFPSLIAPYRPIRIPEPVLTNSPRVDQLIHDGKLELTLQDAVELALENSMDIAVSRYNPWFADTDILQTQAGGQPFGITGAEVRQSFANVPFLNYDPTITTQISYDDRITPVNNPFISGTGLTNLVTGLASHTAQYSNSVTEGFSTGTTATLAWNNTRSSSSSSVNFFNPAVQSALVVTLQQQLLNGFGRFINRRNIMIAKNNRKLADYVFEAQAITTVTGTITAYWELVYARAAVEVQAQAVSVSQRLYGDNKKQLEIGTLAPLDVTRAEAQLATDQQNLIIAQTTKLQDEQILKNAISKDPLGANLINVEIIPTDKPTPPETTEAASFEESIKEAFQKRPELLEQQINITNAGIDARATGIALRPTATLFAQYTSQGLAGVSSIPSTTPGGPPTITQQGFTTAQSQVFQNKFPDYLVGVNVQIPIRNRSAQATNQRSTLQLRQIEAQMQQLKNLAVVDVRNTFIALQQGRVQVETASEQRKLQQQTL